MSKLISRINHKQILIFILILAAFLRLFRLDYPSKFMFDEVYHAYTATQYLQGNKDAWVWWTKAPKEGVAYEWTHPPLAKEIMTASMFLVKSQGGWAWRLPGVLLGIFSVFLIYLLGLKLLNSRVASLIAAFVFSIDGLNFAQSRIGMNDIYYVTFALLSLLLVLNKKYFLAALFFGFAFASKWAAIYMLLILVSLILIQKAKFKLIYFFIIPPAVYLLSYTPFFLSGHTPAQFWELQNQMWWYHTNLKATHSYSSPWWSWPLNLYPVWYFVEYGKDTIANIYGSGNSVLFWLGSLAVVLTIWEAIKIKSQKLFTVALAFLVFWLPWSVSPRIMFLYHFAPTLPFLCLSLGHQLNGLWQTKEKRKFVYLVLILIALSFIIVYPFLTGIPIPKNLVKIFFLTNLSKYQF